MGSRATRLISIFLAGLAACATGAGAGRPAVDLKIEEEKIRAIDSQWVSAVAAHDLDKVVGIFAPDARLFGTNTPQAEGTEAIRKGWSKLLHIPGLTLTLAPASVRVSDDATMAYDVGTYSLGFDQAGGRGQEKGQYVVAWRKLNGEWKVAAECFNSSEPPGPR